MRKLFIFCLVIIFSVSCATHYTLFNSYSGKFYKNEVDSICRVEKIPYINENLWVVFYLMDHETQNGIKQYTYIRKFKNKDNKDVEQAFIAIDLDSLYKFTKRTLIKE